MKRHLLVLAALLVAPLLAAPASAQATRTWVSGVGDDANPCSRTAPCKTFAGAISKTAAGGEINCIDPGGFGAVTITKSITIDCGGTFGSILASFVNGIIVNNAIPATVVDVVIRNVSINGAGNGLNGIRALLPGSLHVENVRIFNFAQKGVDVQPSQGNLTLTILNSTIHLNDNATTGGGVLIRPGASATVDASIFGSSLDRNVFGVRVEDRGNLSIADSSATENVNNGILAVSAAAVAEISLSRVLVANNGVNGIATSGANARVRIAYTSIFNNGTGINTAAGGTVFSFTPATNPNAGNGTPGAPNGAATPLQ